MSKTYKVKKRREKSCGMEQGVLRDGEEELVGVCA
jgi:hypothetical protein